MAWDDSDSLTPPKPESNACTERLLSFSSLTFLPAKPNARRTPSTVIRLLLPKPSRITLPNLSLSPR